MPNERFLWEEQYVGALRANASCPRGGSRAALSTHFLIIINLSEQTVTSYVQIRACPNPNNFFDEVIPKDGINIGDWRLSIRTISMPILNSSEGDTLVDTAWLYAESDYEEAQLARFRQDKLLSFMQIVQALAGVRRMHLSGEIKFSMFFEEFVKDGITRNIEPYTFDVGTNIHRVRVTDVTGTVVFDSATEEAELAQRALQEAKNELRVTAEAVTKHLVDDFFRRAWESFNLAFGKDDHAINHLYDVRDAVVSKFKNGNLARNALGIYEKDWKDFGMIFNDGAVIGGRHNGKHSAPLIPMTHEQRARATRFAKNMLFAYGRYLDNQTATASE